MLITLNQLLKLIVKIKILIMLISRRHQGCLISMKNLPTDLLRAFVTVSELKGFTQAGELLGRSQPAISLQIKRLEGLVDQTLLARNGQSLELTPPGQQLYKYAKQILALNDEAVAKFRKTAVTGTIKFGIPSEFATTLMPRIVGRFAAAYPSVTLEVHSELSKHLLSGANRHQYDLMLVLSDDAMAASGQLLKEDELVWAASNEHEVHLQATLPLIVAPEGCIYRNRGVERLRQSDRDWRVVYTIPDLTGIHAAIKEGLGVTPIARSTVPDDMRVLKHGDRLPKLGTVGVHLINQTSGPNEAVERLVEFVRTALQ